MKSLAAAALFAVSLWTAPASAQTSPRQDSMPILTGHTWQRMTESEKAAFLWGVAHVVDYERHIRVRNRDSDRSASLLPRLEKVLQGRSFEQTLAVIDGYFASDRAWPNRPVLNVLVTEAN